MRKLSAVLMLALTGKTKVVDTKTKRGLLADAHMLTHFFKKQVFNHNFKKHYRIVLKHLKWAIQF
jgi:hypothetical protein